MLASRLIPRTAVRSAFTKSTLPTVLPRWRRSYATEAEEKDLVIIGGGVAGYVAAIKAGQEGMKVRVLTLPREAGREFPRKAELELQVTGWATHFSVVSAIPVALC